MAMTCLRDIAPTLAMLLLMQWATAFAHCRVLLQASAIETAICSAHPDIADASGHEGLSADLDCPACYHVPFTAAADTPVLTVVPVAWVAAPPAPRRGVVATLGPRAPPPPSHAPPTA